MIEVESKNSKDHYISERWFVKDLNENSVDYAVVYEK